MKRGAFDYLVKPIDENHIVAVVRRILEMCDLKRENELLEEKVRERTKALQESYAVLKQKNDDLRRLEQLKDDLTKMIVHDLKSPLTGIIGTKTILSFKSPLTGWAGRSSVSGYFGEEIMKVKVTQQIMIAMAFMTLEAVNQGLGTCWCGAITPNEVHKAMGLPNDIFVHELLPLGYPGEDPKARPRKPHDKIIFWEKYG